jgi:hypothetical protein
MSALVVKLAVNLHWSASVIPCVTSLPNLALVTLASAILAVVTASLPNLALVTLHQ